MNPSQPPELKPGSVKLHPPASPAFDPVATGIPTTASKDAPAAPSPDPTRAQDTPPPPPMEALPLGVHHVKRP
jgi:hypothetical protein